MTSLLDDVSDYRCERASCRDWFWHVLSSCYGIDILSDDMGLTGPLCLVSMNYSPVMNSYHDDRPMYTMEYFEPLKGTCIDYKYRGILRQIRVSYLLGSKNLVTPLNVRLIDYKVSRTDGKQWQCLLRMSLGIQSLFFINVDKYKSDTNNIHASGLNKYLKRFVIEFIEKSGYHENNDQLSFIFNSNAMDAQTQVVACLSLALTYFMLGDKKQCITYCKMYELILNKYNQSRRAIRRSVESWIKPDEMKIKVENDDDMTIDKRFDYFCTIIKKLQDSTNRDHFGNTDYNGSETIKRGEILNVLHDPYGTQKKKHSKYFMKWKELICPKQCAFCSTFKVHKKSNHGFYKCKRCKRVFYCSKKCQKLGWKDHSGSCYPPRFTNTW